MQVRVIVELRVPKGQHSTLIMQEASGLNVPTFSLDPNYGPIPIRASSQDVASLSAANEEAMIVRGMIDDQRIPDLRALPNVMRASIDGPVAPFISHDNVEMVPLTEFGDCPISPCDCASRVPKGAIADVANYLGVDQIWAAGYRGAGIVIGIVDGGITAEGRPIAPGDETAGLIPNVIGGWPEDDWGTTGLAWTWHGNMTATDALGMAPAAQIYDIRISGGAGTEGSISNALEGFQWAIEQHMSDGTPHILSNSWGIFQEAWDEEYATDPDHMFTRKVVDALDEGILVLFAAGNCGERCPDGRCDTDTGPGRSIWGANGHPRVMTVGAVNTDEEFIGYSSQGPAALDPHKPDFCSISHFSGYFDTDSGTSAATPIAAGVVALLKQAKPPLTQTQAMNALTATAKDIGPAGDDIHSGFGIIQAKAAFDAPLDIGRVLEAEGTVTMLRAHDVDTKYGKVGDQIDVEAVIWLDSKPGQAFGFQLRNDANESSHRRMFDILRDAFNNDRQVRIDYVRKGLKNGDILRVREIA